MSMNVTIAPGGVPRGAEPPHRHRPAQLTHKTQVVHNGMVLGHIECLDLFHRETPCSFKAVCRLPGHTGRCCRLCSAPSVVPSAPCFAATNLSESITLSNSIGVSQVDDPMAELQKWLVKGIGLPNKECHQAGKVCTSLTQPPLFHWSLIRPTVRRLAVERPPRRRRGTARNQHVLCFHWPHKA